MLCVDMGQTNITSQRTESNIVLTTQVFPLLERTSWTICTRVKTHSL
jgi:hypothetical protein